MARPRLALGLRSVAGLAGHAQVGQLGDAVGRQDDVGRLHVAMDQAALVGVLQRLGDLQDDLHRLLLLVDLARVQFLADGLALDYSMTK